MDGRRSRGVVRLALALALLALGAPACGRLGFDARDGAGIDGAARDGGGALRDAPGIDAPLPDGVVPRRDAPGTDGGSTGPCVEIAPTYVGFGSLPDVAIFEESIVIAYGDTGSILIRTVPLDGSGPTAGFAIAGTVDASHPALLSGAAGVGVAYEDRRGAGTEVWLSGVTSAFMAVRMSGTGSDASAPAIAGVGDRAIVVYQDDADGDYEIYGRLVLDATPTFGPTFPVTSTSSASQEPAVAGGPRRGLLAWQEDPDAVELWVRPLGVDGALDGANTRVAGFTGSVAGPAAAAGPSGFVVVVSERRGVDDEIALVPFSDDGAQLGPPVVVSPTGATEPAIAPFGDAFALAWVEAAGVAVVRVDGAGAVVGAPMRFSASAPTHVSVASTGNGVAVAFDAEVGGGTMVAYAHACF